MTFRSSFATLAVLAATAGPAAANLVANPGFETGDLGSWTVTGDGISADAYYPNTGSYDAAFGAGSYTTDPGVLSQALPTTAGQTYAISFALFDEAGLMNDWFTVDFGTLSQTITGDRAASYTVFSFTTLGSDGSTTLSFHGLNDNGDWNLDDVSVTPAASNVPEPSTWTLMLVAFAGICALSRRRRVMLDT